MDLDVLIMLAWRNTFKAMASNATEKAIAFEAAYSQIVGRAMDLDVLIMLAWRNTSKAMASNATEKATAFEAAYSQIVERVDIRKQSEDCR